MAEDTYVLSNQNLGHKILVFEFGEGLIAKLNGDFVVVKREQMGERSAIAVLDQTEFTPFITGSFTAYSLETGVSFYYNWQPEYKGLDEQLKAADKYFSKFASLK